MSEMKIIECPRDAMQGVVEWIPTSTKIEYINALLSVGYDTLDFGSFVSPKAIPQLKDTEEVLAGLALGNTTTKLLAIVANERGAQNAAQHADIRYLGYPFSISETFQKRNTNASISESLLRAAVIQDICIAASKELVIYISMGFGNPYGDPWSADVAIEWCEKLHRELGVSIMSLADTIGISNPENIDYLFRALLQSLPDVEFGAHLHSTPQTQIEKLEAAWGAGCRRIDAAMLGFGGCPMADDELVGNMSTESLLAFLKNKNVDTLLDMHAFQHARKLASRVFHTDI
jgi:hydroxymethylglutaryl-CoA lyase